MEMDIELEKDWLLIIEIRIVKKTMVDIYLLSQVWDREKLICLAKLCKIIKGIIIQDIRDIITKEEIIKEIQVLRI